MVYTTLLADITPFYALGMNNYTIQSVNRSELGNL